MDKHHRRRPRSGVKLAACVFAVIVIMGVITYAVTHRTGTSDSTPFAEAYTGPVQTATAPDEPDDDLAGRSPTPTETGGQVEDDSDTAITVVRGAGNIYDVTVDPDRYYYTADELAAGLLYDLEPLAPLLVAAQEEYGIDAVFLAAVAALESGWGRYEFRPYNLFGFERHDFTSYEHGINYCAAYLADEYLTPGGAWYEGVGVAEVNIHYNGRDHWAEQVAAIMAQIVDRVERSKAECTE